MKDTSGGTLPGATVTAVNSAQAVTQTANTDGQGVFVFAQLLPGTYALKVELSGFKAVERSNVILPTKSAINVGEIVLDVGSMTETVTVEADVGRLQIQTESAERSDLVTNKQLRDVALNGRNIADLFKTIPGVIAGTTQTTSTVQNVVGSFNINGTRANQHEYTVDGVTNLNLGNNTGALVTINPDAVEEVKILTSNYQAEYGRAGGGFIALTTRGGTSEYRGGGRYFRRHESYNANNFFNNASGRPRPFYRYDYYGWDFGGPVPFLGSKGDRKVFFFAAQEYYQQETPNPNPSRIRVPTAAERGGNFSDTRDGNGRLLIIRDPLTGLPFPGNVIPSSRFAPGMQGLLSVFPSPNAPEGGSLYNFTSQPPRDIPRREDILRVDWQIASGTRLSARYIHNKDEDVQPLGTTTAAFNFPLAPSSVVRRNGPGDVFSATLTHTFSPNLVNEFTYGMGRGGVFIGPVNLDEVGRDSLGVNTPLLFPGADPEGVIPSVRFLGIANQTCPATGVANCATPVMDFNGTPFDQKFAINNFMDNVTMIRGNHRFKGGVYYQRANNRRTSFGPVQSNLVFGDSNPQNTGHPFANALLGIFDTYTQAEQKITSNYFYQDISAYIQDTWKVRSRLTLDYGLRVSHYQPIYDKEDRLGFFNPDLFDPARAVRLYRPACLGVPCTGANLRAIDPSVTAPPSLSNTRPGNYVATIVAGSGDSINGIGRVADGYPAGGFETPSLLWGPRLGFAWDATGDSKTVVRGGFGVSFDRIDTDRIADAITNPPGIQVSTLSNGSLSDLAGASRSDLQPVTGDVVGYRRDQKVPTVYSFSLGVQRDLGKGIVVDLAYVGTRSRHNPRQTDLNAIPYGTMFTRRGPEPGRLWRRGPRRRAQPAAGLPRRRAPLHGGQRPQSQPAPALPRIRRDALPQLRQQGRLQRAAGRPAATVLKELHLRPLLHALARAHGLRRHHRRDESVRPRGLRLRAGQLRPDALLRRQLRLVRAQGQRAPRRRRVRARPARQLDGLRDLVDRVGQPHRADPLHRRRQRRPAPAGHGCGRHVGRAAAALPRGGKPRKQRRHAQSGRLRRARARGLRALRPLLPA